MMKQEKRLWSPGDSSLGTAGKFIGWLNILLITAGLIFMLSGCGVHGGIDATYGAHHEPVVYSIESNNQEEVKKKYIVTVDFGNTTESFFTDCQYTVGECLFPCESLTDQHIPKK